MNYVCAVYAVVVSIIAIDWLARARKEYRGQTDRREAAAATDTVRHASIVSFGQDRTVGAGGGHSGGVESVGGGELR